MTKTCRRGHPLVGVNRTKRGQCRECLNEAGRQWRASGKAWNTMPPATCPHCHSDLTVMGAVYRYPGSGRWECRQCKKNRSRQYRQERQAWTATPSPFMDHGPAKTS